MYTENICKLLSLLNTNCDRLKNNLDEFSKVSNIKSENQLIAYILYDVLINEKIVFTKEDLKNYFDIEIKNIIYKKINRLLKEYDN